MLQITPQHRLLLAIEPIDFRKGIDSLAALCRKILHVDPFTGTVFVFTSKRRTGVKVFVYDGSGFWLCQKRFSSGKLKWWPRTKEEACKLHAVELMIMLQQGDPTVANIPENWHHLAYPDLLNDPQ